MAFHRPISVKEAAAIAKVTVNAILKRIKVGKMLAVQLSGKGWMVCREHAAGKAASGADFRRLCGKFISVPQACDIVFKTDASVIRDLKNGRLTGFQLNGRAWAVLRESAEQEIRDYLNGSHDGLPGRRRRIGDKRSPDKKRQLKKIPAKIQSRRSTD